MQVSLQHWGIYRSVTAMDCPGQSSRVKFSGLSPGDPEAESHFCGSDRPSLTENILRGGSEDYSDTLSCSERGLKATPALSHRGHARREA